MQQPIINASCTYGCNVLKFYRQIALNDRMQGKVYKAKIPVKLVKASTRM